MQLLSKNLLSVYGNRIFIQSGFAVVSVFLPTFFYLEFGGELTYVIAVYVAAYLCNTLLTPLTAKLICTWGMRKLMMVAVFPFLIAGMTAMAFWEVAPLWMLAVYIFGWTVYRSLYWVPYHVEVTSFLDTHHRGRQVSLYTNVASAMLVVAPLIGGFLINSFGFVYAFVLSLILFCSSFIPLLYMRETHEEFSFKYFETFRRLFSSKNRPLLLAYMGDGAQNAVNLIFWPVFIFLILHGDFLAVGAVSALVTLATFVIRFMAGEMIDKANKTHLLLFSSVIFTTGWFLKSFATTAIHIFLFDAYHQAGKALHRISFDAGTYEQSADNGHFVDEFTVLKEMALNIGRVLMLIVGGILAALFGIKVAFVLAALASLLMVLLNKGLKVR